MEIQFLTVDDVIFDQERQLELYGGGDPGIISRGGLESAVAMPQAGFGGEYRHKDEFEMGSAYLFHLVAGHAFGNGNKRIGLAAALVFLRINGVVVNAPDDALYEMVMGVAASGKGKDDVSAFLRLHGTASGVRATDETRESALCEAREWMHRTYPVVFKKLAE